MIWIGVADRSAGIADDLVLGLPGMVVGHQFKTSTFAKAFQIEALLLGAEGMLLKLVTAWANLHDSHAEDRTEIRFVTNDIPSQANNDHLLADKDDHSAAFLQEFELYHHRTLAEWRDTRWQPLLTGYLQLLASPMQTSKPLCTQCASSLDRPLISS